MKKILKISIIIICVFLATCQINNKVYSYTISQVKSITEFKILEEGKKPKKYDILIDAKDLIYNEKLPCIRNSIDTVLYGTNDFFSIEFFNKSLEKNNPKWKVVRKGVDIFLRISLYIVAACMLTLLIYIAVIIVKFSISQKDSILPLGNVVKEGKNDKPEKHIKEKKLLEEWIKSVLMLAVIVFIINLIINGSNVLTEISDKYKTEESKENYITVYVKNSKMNTNNDSGGSNLQNSEAIQKVIDQASSLDNLGVPGGYCEAWVEKVYESALNRDIPNQCCAHKAGQNSIISTSTTNIAPGAAVFSYRSSGAVIDNSGCGQDAGHVGIYIGDGKIASCTGRGDTGITICTVEEWQQSWQFDGWGWLPGLDDISNGAGVDSTGEEEVIDYCFKTNLEGLLMFQSQYNWETNKLKNVVNIICGFFVTFFKYFIYFLLVSRMFIVALLIIVAPIVILINAIMKINGNKGFFNIWIKLFLYFVFLRPVLSLLYYALVKTNVYLVCEFPFYILLVILVIFGLFCLSIRQLIRSFSTNKQKNIANSKL